MKIDGSISKDVHEWGQCFLRYLRSAVFLLPLQTSFARHETYFLLWKAPRLAIDHRLASKFAAANLHIAERLRIQERRFLVSAPERWQTNRFD
jgi:hypothetical protein